MTPTLPPSLPLPLADSPIRRFADSPSLPLSLSPFLLLPLLLSAPALAQSQTQPLDPDSALLVPEFGQQLWRMLLSLLAIIVGLLIAAKLLSRFLGHRLPRQNAHLIQVVECHRLEPRKAVYLLKVADQYLLVGSSEAGLHTLSGGPIDPKLIEAALAREKHQPTRSFAQVLDSPTTPNLPRSGQ